MQPAVLMLELWTGQCARGLSLLFEDSYKRCLVTAAVPFGHLWLSETQCICCPLAAFRDDLGYVKSINSHEHSTISKRFSCRVLVIDPKDPGAVQQFDLALRRRRFADVQKSCNLATRVKTVCRSCTMSMSLLEIIHSDLPVAF